MLRPRLSQPAAARSTSHWRAIPPTK